MAKRQVEYWLNKTEAGRRMGVCRQTVDSYVEEGLKCYHRGKKMFFSPDDIDDFIRSGNTPQTVSDRAKEILRDWRK